MDRGQTDVGSEFVDDLGIDQMALVVAGDERIVVARTERGLAAFDDRCSHKGGPLSDGSLACGIVQCPWHGSQFNVHTGDVKQGPADRPIDTYTTRTAHDRVAIRARHRSS